ncbi:MAG TPA: trypsin-like serine protease [Candidatus Cybelea sp.]|jgi:hypothetical protein|nr:trypsin-like serine protease [Candidatus Cybelea sp.]
MKLRVLASVALVGLVASACASHLSPLPAGSITEGALRYDATIPPSYQCFPSGLPHATGPDPLLAYIDQCSVAKAKEHANLQKLAIAMMIYHAQVRRFISYCTGTPVKAEDIGSVHVAFVVTAAHCVVGGDKAAHTKVTAANISTFANHGDYVYQGTPGILTEGNRDLLTGKIDAVYVPSRYCEVPAFDSDGSGCADLQKQNGDLAVLKIVSTAHTVDVLPNLKLAPADLSLTSASYVMALGYGINTTKTPQDRALYYVDYQYFATDDYQHVPSENSLMNGYFKDSNFYNIICQGDSGGGDFAWDGKDWLLAGDHSWGAIPCGVWSSRYTQAQDVSADLRPWDSFISTILTEDRDAKGCKDFGAHYVCAAAP